MSARPPSQRNQASEVRIISVNNVSSRGIVTTWRDASVLPAAVSVATKLTRATALAPARSCAESRRPSRLGAKPPAATPWSVGSETMKGVTAVSRSGLSASPAGALTTMGPSARGIGARLMHIIATTSPPWTTPSCGKREAAVLVMARTMSSWKQRLSIAEGSVAPGIGRTGTSIAPKNVQPADTPAQSRRQRSAPTSLVGTPKAST
eukprot:scaffold85381_cov30-Tisochrysis_lutea.AAC.3